jgi:iron complex outermembrane receptor protein
MRCKLMESTPFESDVLRAAVRAVLATGLTRGSLTFLALPAAAQQGSAAAPAQSAALEEIVVTAQRREQSIQDVPVSVSAFTAKDIENRAATNLIELAATTPNVSFNTSVTGQDIRIRGVGASDTTLIFDPGVGVYVDGLYLPRMSGLNLDLIGIERVELLRGPQGTLFGRNTIGGAINITTSRPSDEFSGDVELTTGSYGRFDALLGIEGPIADGTLSGRLAGVIRSRDGYGERLDFATGGKIDEADNVDRYAVRGSLDWTPTESVDVLLSADVGSIDEKGQLLHIQKTFPTRLVTTSNIFTTPDYNDQFVAADPHANYATGPNYNKSDTWSTSMTIDWKLSPSSKFRSITAYYDAQSKVGNDLDGSPLNLFEQNATEDATYFSQELQLGGLAFDERLNWLTGLYYGKETGHLHSDALLFQTLYTSPFRVDLSQKLDIWTDNWNGAAFGQGTYNITDKLSMTAGARYSYDWKQVEHERASVNTGAITLPFDKMDDNWAAWSGRFGFEYRWTPDVMGYISAARGFKSGGINGASTTAAAFQPFDPEYLWTYEAGLRSEWFDKSLRFNASVFYSDYSDMQFRVYYQAPSGALDQIVENVGASTVKGFELELQAVPVENLLLTASVGYLNGEYTKAAVGSPITLKDEMVDMPEWSFTVMGDFTVPLQAGSKLVAHVDASYKAEQQRLLANSPYGVQPSYTLLNARLAFTTADDHWEAAVFGTNITDEVVLSWAYDIRTAMNIFGEYAAPRMWGASLKYSF